MTASVTLLHGMVRHEYEIGVFYRECARQYPDHDAFWRQLADEESEHARLLGTLLPLAEQGKLQLKVDAVRPEMLSVFTRYVGEQTRLIAQSVPPMGIALNIALDLEDTLLERDALVHFIDDAGVAASVAHRLTLDTRSHMNRLNAMKVQKPLR